MAGRVTSENLGRGTERMGVAQRKATSYLADAATARGAARGVEGRARRDPPSGGRGEGGHPIVGVLYADPAARRSGSRRIAASIDKTAAALIEAARAAYALHAQRLNTPPVVRAAADAPRRRRRANLIVRVHRPATFSGCAAAAAAVAGGAGGGARAAEPRRRWRTRRHARAVAAAAHERGAEHPARQETERRSRFATSCRASSSPCRSPT